ncbi:medium-chain acyl-[acyl-carrier-protein] hydrolase [Pelomyxa schiedti]|nr:medium-chain acyl-[acyl-carrier-protein] hydrolase [Pelomyxa schiedti]
MEVEWVARFMGPTMPKKPNPAVKLFCFHHAGGNFNDYRKWEMWLPAEIQVCSIILPGHIGRNKEPLCLDLNELADKVTAGIKPFIDRPYAIYGHSMGSILGYEVMRRLMAQGFAAPLGLFVSGRRAPHLKDPENPADRKSSIVDDQVFITKMSTDFHDTTLLSMSQQYPDMLLHFLPVLRGDIRAHDYYEHKPLTAPFNVPFFVYQGSSDHTSSPAQMAAWQQHTSRPLTGPEWVEGDHFWVKQDSVAQKFIGKAPDQCIILPPINSYNLQQFQTQRNGSIHTTSI